MPLASRACRAYCLAQRLAADPVLTCRRCCPGCRAARRRRRRRCCRDFTNAALPAGEPDMRMIEGLLPAAGGTDGPSNVLSVSFDSMTYPVTVDGVHTVGTALRRRPAAPGRSGSAGARARAPSPCCGSIPCPPARTTSEPAPARAPPPPHPPLSPAFLLLRGPAPQIFSTYGTVQKIHIFERDGRTVALVQYPDIPTADKARAALEGHAMYDGGHNVVSWCCSAACPLPLPLLFRPVVVPEASQRLRTAVMLSAGVLLGECRAWDVWGRR
jgi:hypothetical protein